MGLKRYIPKKALGFTLLETLLALVITGTIVGIVSASYIQILKGKSTIVQRSVAMTDIDSAAHFLTRDLILAQTTSLQSGAPPTSVMTVEWSDRTAWAADTGTVAHSASYNLSGNQLLRTYDGETTTVGRYLTQAHFSIDGDGKIFTITLTSHYGIPGYTVTRSFIIEMRTDLAP